MSAATSDTESKGMNALESALARLDMCAEDITRQSRELRAHLHRITSYDSNPCAEIARSIEACFRIVDDMSLTAAWADVRIVDGGHEVGATELQVKPSPEEREVAAERASISRGDNVVPFPKPHADADPVVPL